MKETIINIFLGIIAILSLIQKSVIKARIKEIEDIIINLNKNYSSTKDMGKKALIYCEKNEYKRVLEELKKLL